MRVTQLQRATEFIVALISIVVMIGWFTRSQFVVQLHPSFHPMQFNTALGFLLSVCMMFCLRTKRTRAGIVFAGMLVLIYGLTLLQYLLETDFGIDTLIVVPFVTETGAHAGRPGANTTLCFVLLGVVGGISVMRSMRAVMWSGVITACIMGMSLASLWGYLVGTEALAGWRTYLSGMAVHTAIAFILCGWLCFAYLGVERTPSHAWYSAFRPIHSVLVMLVMSMTISNAMYEWHQRKVRERIAEKVEILGASINNALATNESAFHRMVKRWQHNPRMSSDAWRADARSYIQDIPALVSMHLRSEADRVEWDEPEQNKNVFLIDDTELLDSTNLSLRDVDGDALIVEQINFRSNPESRCSLVAVLSLRVLIEKLGSPFLDDYEIRVTSGAHTYMSTRSRYALVERMTCTTTLNVEGDRGEIRLAFVPLSNFVMNARSPWPTAVLIGGILLSGIVWVMVYQANQLAIARSREVQNAMLRVHASELETSNTELRALNTELEQFTYSMSHDLKSPLFCINGYMKMLEDHLRETQIDAESEAMIEPINRAVRRMSTTIESVLKLYRVSRQQDDHRDVDLAELVGLAINSVEYQLKEAGGSVLVEDPVIPIHANKELVLRVLQNLIVNATKYARVGGQVLTIRVSTIRAGDMVQLSVEDNGPGIEPQFREKVFELFQRLGDSQADGTGIGLNIVSKVAQMHSGRAWVEDSELGGAKFSVTFPHAHELEPACIAQVTSAA